jgi:drug/metabolite transporter (DMT)-like permease
MQSNTVERADKISRKRAILIAAAGVVFVAGQILGHPFFDTGPSDLQISRRIAWAVNAVLLLALLATGGGILNSREIRMLVNDEISRMNYKTSVIVGFWVAMTCALLLFAVPAFVSFTAHQAVYLIVTAAVATASLTFAWLEYRAHRDA